MGSSLMNHCKICLNKCVLCSRLPPNRCLPQAVCGNMFPAPLLIESDQATITFVSDGSNAGRGFELIFTAVHKESEAGDLAYAIETPLLSFLIHLK